MNPPTTPSPSCHRLHLGGIASRYAPYLMIGGTLLAIGVGLLLLAASRPDRSTLIPGLLFAVGGPLFLIPMYLGLAGHPREIETSAAGLRWVVPEGEHQVDWEDIREVYRYEKITNQTFREAHLIVVLADGERLDWNQSLSDFNQLADTVQASVCARLAPKLRADLQSGSAAFGPIVLRPSGLSFNGTDLPWDRLDQIAVARGFLILGVRTMYGSRSESVAVGQIPNFPVFFGLLQETCPMPLQR